MWKISILVLFTVEVLTYEKEMTEEQKQKFKEALDKYCKANGAEDMADEALIAIRNTGKCIAGIVNLNVIKEEIKGAKADGTMNTVMAKYCEQAEDLKSCITSMTNKMSVCMNEIVRAHIAGYNSAIDGFIDFACYEQDGKLNIATFIAEGGLDCIEDKKNDIKGCSAKMKNNVFWEHCDDFDTFSACQIKVMKSCPKPAPGILVEHLLQTTRAKSPCDKSYKSPKSNLRANSADLPTQTTEETTEAQETTSIDHHNYDDLEISTTALLKRTTKSRKPDEDPMAKYTMSVKQRQKFRSGMKRYCLQNGGDVRDADELELAMKNLLKCFIEIMDQKKVKKQMEMALPFGKKMMKKVFGKYCERSDSMKICIYGMTKKAVNCMTENTRYQLDGYNGVVSVVINFWCYDGAERLGMFFTQDGPNCLENTFEQLVDCTLYLKKGTVFWENCDTFDQFASCIVKELAACSRMTISLMARRLFREIFNASQCRSMAVKYM